MNNPIARKEKLVVQEMPDEVLVYDLNTHKAHCLNKTAAFVWSCCDGGVSAAEIANLSNEEGPEPITEEMVWLAIKQLSKANLLENTVVVPVAVPHVSRRAMLSKLGLAAAVTLPLVSTILVPTAVQAGASCASCIIFGSGGGRANICPSACGSTQGACYNNSSCNGAGGQFPNDTCDNCYNNNPTSSSWRPF